MRTDIYPDIKNTLLAVPGVKGCRLWNRQTEKPDRIIDFPFCFVQFPRIPWETRNSNSQETANFGFSVHIVSQTLTEGDEDKVFPLSQEVYKALQAQGYKRTAEETDHDHNQIIDQIVSFEFAGLLEDAEAAKTHTIISKKDDLVNSPEITPSIQ